MSQLRQTFFQVSTPRLVLRDLEDADTASFGAIFNAPENLPHNGFKVHSDDEIREIVADMMNDRTESPRDKFRLASFLEGEMIGQASIRMLPDHDEYPEIGLSFKNGYTGQGYGTEIMTTLIETTFNHFAADRLISLTNPKNADSIRLFEKMGMSLDKIIPESYFNGRDYEDDAVYLMTRNGWQAKRRAFSAAHL